MNSFNHYSLGSCGEFFFEGIGGINSASPGYDQIRVQPVILPGLTWAKASYHSIHGDIATAWKLNGKHLALQVIIPANTTATVIVPSSDPSQVREGGKPVANANGVRLIGQETDRAKYQVGSGTYRFESTWDQVRR